MEIAHERDGAAVEEKTPDQATHSANNTLPTLVVVGTESALFDKNSPVRERILAYTPHFKKVAIIVMCGRGYAETFVNEHVTIHPTNSASSILRPLDALMVARTLSSADIVSVQDPFETGLAGMWIAKRMNARLHVQVHTDFLSPAYASLSLLNRLRIYVASSVIARADRIRVVSERIKRSIAQQYKPRAEITVLPIYVKTEWFRDAVAPTALITKFQKFSSRLLVVSRLEPEKNVALAIESFASAAPADACLIILGNGREGVRLAELAKKLKVDARVFFEGPQDPAPYYKLADLVLFPSKYDGYGLVVVEALAAQRPVIATDVGAAKEAGAIIADIAHFASALGEWYNSGPKRAELQNYPYHSFEEYVQAYGDDIAGCIKK